ncbi:TIGR03086 family metal-binding protein [Kribbella sp. NPDC056951]|uniref:TIGR03086 family metal-binding protein n=1 Tax=Kribbella sp. NPDC056951 TaxID=3345978 RepID=UPI00363955CD
MEVVELHNRSVEGFVRLVAVVGDEQWSAVTPCADWDVRALVNHVVGEERWTAPLMAGQTIADVGSTLDGDLLGSDPAAAASEAGRAAQAAAALPATAVHLSYGDEDPAEYLRQLIADHLIHTWDLAAAIGADRSLDPDLIGPVADWFADRAELYRSMGMVSAPIAGFTAPGDVLLGTFGRDPRWTP